MKAENPLVAHGLKWTQVESISMDEYTVQPKYAVINFRWESPLSSGISIYSIISRFTGPVDKSWIGS